jgi:hypothetical protein
MKVIQGLIDFFYALLGLLVTLVTGVIGAVGAALATLFAGVSCLGLLLIIGIPVFLVLLFLAFF